MTTTGSGRGMMLVCFVVMGIYKQRGKKKRIKRGDRREPADRLA